MAEYAPPVDPKVERMVDKLLPRVLADEPLRTKFSNSRFACLKAISPRIYGERAKKLTQRMILEAGLYPITPSPKERYDFKANGLELAVRLTSESETEGGFTVAQLRPRDTYSVMVVWVILEDAALLYTVPREVLFQLANGQHGGKKAKETLWYKPRSIEQLHENIGEYYGWDCFKKTLYRK